MVNQQLRTKIPPIGLTMLGGMTLGPAENFWLIN